MTKAHIPVRLLQVAFLLVTYYGAIAFCLALSVSVDATSGAWDPNFAPYQAIFASSRVLDALLSSVQLGLYTVIIVLPMAIALARTLVALHSGVIKLLLLSILVLPLLSSSILRMFGYAMLLSSSGPISWLFGIVSVSFPSLLYTQMATVVGLVSIVMPIAVIICVAQLIRIPADQIMAASNLGASRWQIFARIELPHSLSALVVSAQMSMLVVLGDMFAQPVLGGNRIYTFAAALHDRVKIDDWPAAAAMSVVLMLGVCALVGTIGALGWIRRSLESSTKNAIV